jgi:hypothetical protein
MKTTSRKVKVTFTPVPFSETLYIGSRLCDMQPAGASVVFINPEFPVAGNYLNVSFSAVGIGSKCTLTIEVDGDTQTYTGRFSDHKMAVVNDALHFPVGKPKDKPVPYPPIPESAPV